MRLKDIIRSRISVTRRLTGDALISFIHWARMIDAPLLHTLLSEIHQELEVEAQHFCEISELVGAPLLHHQLRLQWCHFCSQLQAYYRPMASGQHTIKLH